jgi:ribA/ribD-fused uncharacterized protein
MDRCSQFIKKRALFGSFPTQDAVRELEEEGVRYFIDLTTGVEDKTTPYTTNYTYIKYPIVDRRTPDNWKSFSVFIIKVSDIISNLEEGQLIYVHCKGGHGRSGVVVACLLCYMFGITPTNALERTTKYHSRRSVMRDKWRSLGSPQTRSQKSFVHRFFEPLFFYRAYKLGHTAGLSNFSDHSVTIPQVGMFPTAEAAFQSFRNPTDSEYISMQKSAKTPVNSKYIGKMTNTRKDWFDIRDFAMRKVIEFKFSQHEDIRANLLNTCIRPLISQTADYYWGIGVDSKGENKLGKIMTSVRDSFLREQELL